MPDEVVALVDVSHCGTLQEEQGRIKTFKQDVIKISELTYAIHKRQEDKKRLSPKQFDKLCAETVSNLEKIIHETVFWAGNENILHATIKSLNTPYVRPQGKQPLYLYSLHINFINLSIEYKFQIKQCEPVLELLRFIRYWSRTDFDVPSFVRKTIEMKDDTDTIDALQNPSMRIDNS